MTRKLYYEDCHLLHFSAKVTGCEQAENRWRITLDATAFYPEGGGQAADVGTLGGVRVLDTREEGEAVIHFCDGPLEVGSTVEGQVDEAHRFDLMQQHTGEHIVSGLLHSRFGYENTGFHVGKDVMEVDFSGTLTAEDIDWVEKEANKAIWQNLPVKCWYPSPEELPNVVYRTKRTLPWPVRIVQVGNVDSCACCGIHVAYTGEVGLIKILSAAKFHGGVRLEMVCGQRAWDYVAAICAQNRQVSQLFSARPLETASAAQKIADSLAAEKYRCWELEKRLLGITAERYINQQNPVHFEAELSGNALRELAEQMSQVCRGFAAVFAGEDGSYRYCLASRELDLRPVGKALTAALHGRGGGKPEAQQGTVCATRKEIENFFENF